MYLEVDFLGMLEDGNNVTHHTHPHLPKDLLLKNTSATEINNEHALLQYLIQVWQHVLSDSVIIKYVCIAKREREINKAITAMIYVHVYKTGGAAMLH